MIPQIVRMIVERCAVTFLNDIIFATFTWPVIKRALKEPYRHLVAGFFIWINKNHQATDKQPKKPYNMIVLFH